MSSDMSFGRDGTALHIVDTPQSGRTDRPRTPLYIVCSPRRSVGKTLLSRVVTEFHVIDDRPVAAFDLGEEEPQLADFLPECTKLADISDTRGQMAFFDGLLVNGGTTKVIDLSHRAFTDFFIVVQKIGFFEEARRNGIEPIVLFMVDLAPKTAKAYAILQRWFADASLVPVRNPFVSSRVPFCGDFRNNSAIQVAVEIPVLAAPLKPVVGRSSFSFAEFWRATPVMLPERLDDELRAWMKRVFLQIREIELCVMCRGIVSALAPLI
jgi:hypothetical protein